MALTNRFIALKDLPSETLTEELAYLVGASIVRSVQELGKVGIKMENIKTGKSCVGQVSELLISQDRSET